MKIGQFARQNHLSIEAIRHYMDLGLIIPEKKGGHYFYDERCQKDLVQRSLITCASHNEISSILYFQ